MPSVVVFDCFDTLVTSRPLPDAETWPAVLAETLDLDARDSGAVVREVFGTLYTAMSDRSATQPATLHLLEAALRKRGLIRDRPDQERALWQALGCDDPGQYQLCAPVAEALRRAADAGHTVRLLSNCYLPGSQMRLLLERLGVPPVWERALFTADGGPKKPDPRAFGRVGDGDFQRRVMVGDSAELDIVPAAALGWETVHIDPAAPDPAPLYELLGC
ncbi:MULTISPECIES: HAD family hydrolase [unclassified Streptomyces]|uniref:HAD family hydrolase n=1 Tax=unclassified Streptomyces TaxID=2593676 RepID=UPI000CD51AA7|nr:MULTISPECIES: HAD family hydrolase [unclassified Streptomyces]